MASPFVKTSLLRGGDGNLRVSRMESRVAWRGQLGFLFFYSIFLHFCQIFGRFCTKQPVGSGEDTLAPPSRPGVAIPPATEQALLGALAVNAGQRFQAMGEFQEALLGQKPVTGMAQPAPAEFIREPSPVPPVKPPLRKDNWTVPAILISGLEIGMIMIGGTISGETKAPGFST
jgi:hypothetical protein